MRSHLLCRSLAIFLCFLGVTLARPLTAIEPTVCDDTNGPCDCAGGGAQRPRLAQRLPPVLPSALLRI